VELFNPEILLRMSSYLYRGFPLLWLKEVKIVFLFFSVLVHSKCLND